MRDPLSIIRELFPGPTPWPDRSKARAAAVAECRVRFREMFGQDVPSGWTEGYRALYSRMLEQEQNARDVARDFRRYPLSTARSRAKKFLEHWRLDPGGGAVPLDDLLQTSPTTRQLVHYFEHAPPTEPYDSAAAKGNRSCDRGPLPNIATPIGFVIWFFEHIPRDEGPVGWRLEGDPPGERRYAQVTLTDLELAMLGILIFPEDLTITNRDLKGTTIVTLIQNHARKVKRARRRHGYQWNAFPNETDAERAERLARDKEHRRRGGALVLPFPK